MARAIPGILPLAAARPCASCCVRVLSTSSGWSRIADVNPDKAPKRRDERRTEHGKRRTENGKRRFKDAFAGVLCQLAGTFRTRLRESDYVAYQRRNAVRGSSIAWRRGSKVEERIRRLFWIDLRLISEVDTWPPVIFGLFYPILWWRCSTCVVDIPLDRSTARSFPDACQPSIRCQSQPEPTLTAQRSCIRADAH